MMRNLLTKYNIDSFAFIDASLCREANSRLYNTIPEGARVIFMLFPYYSGDCGKRISAYGAVFDYHTFAREVFSSLEGYINEKYPERYVQGFADHSPYLECEGAALAGLGIIGENSLLITKEYSSYVFIGELVTTLTREELLSEGIPEGGGTIARCEGCSACKSACPALCCGSLDRSGCISSLSQKKGELTDTERELLKKGGSIWGCDICQRVCPHTKRALREGTIYTPIEFFKNSYISADPSEFIKNADDDTFCAYPFAWRKRPTVERNIDIIKGLEK